MLKILKIISMQSLQYLKKELSYEVDIFYVNKHETLLQVDSIIFDRFDPFPLLNRESIPSLFFI